MITRDQLLYNFRLAQLRLEAAKANEMRWRMVVASTFDNVQRGTNTSADGRVKLVSKVNVNLIKDRDLIQATLTKYQAEFGADAPTGFIEWQFKLSDTAFLALDDRYQIALSDIVTITPATPTVSIVE